MKFFTKLTVTVMLALVALASFPFLVQADTQSSDPAQVAESIRKALFQAQLALVDNPDGAKQHLQDAKQFYTDTLSEYLSQQVPAIDQKIQESFVEAEQAQAQKDAASFSAIRADIWIGLLTGSYHIVEKAITAGDAKTAQVWLRLRDFRQSTRFSRPNADATLAIEALAAKKVSPADALLSVRADLLDTYQARLNEVMNSLVKADADGFVVQRAEYAALADGYFSLLAPAYREQRGEEALTQLLQDFANLRAAALAGSGVPEALKPIEELLHGFRAAPLSSNDRTRRANQLLRFLSLVPIEYERGVANGVVIRDFEVREAVTFRNGAEAAFADLQNLLEQRDKAKTARAEQMLQLLEQKLADASTKKNVVSPDEIKKSVEELTTLLKEIIPADWQKRSAEGDFDVIAAILDQMISAVAQQRYDLAESARLEAYSILESGPEARLVAFAPEYVKPIEDLFWFGQEPQKGFAYLIANKASVQEFKVSRAALDEQLNEAQRLIRSSGSPYSVATNAAIIVFREGLEAVLILASLMGSLKRGEVRKLRRPLWVGAGLALVGTVITWILAQGILTSLTRYGEVLEAVVSLIAIAVLLLITNWFFHKVYWTGWIANFHSQKRKLLNAELGQWVGLATLGFTSIYREGFETVLFLQALVLESGVSTVLGGTGLGLLGTFVVGVIVFALQMKLPYKKMLVYTGVMIGAVLLIMVGNTVQTLQVVGWLPIHSLGFIQFPYWAGIWFGLYATWEGILLQFASGAFVIGSYFLAEHQQKQRSDKGDPPSTGKKEQKTRKSKEATPAGRS